MREETEETAAAVANNNNSDVVKCVCHEEHSRKRRLSVQHLVPPRATLCCADDTAHRVLLKYRDSVSVRSFTLSRLELHN